MKKYFPYWATLLPRNFYGFTVSKDFLHLMLSSGINMRWINSYQWQKRPASNGLSLWKVPRTSIVK
jgi:hypothetical protein